MKKIYLLHLYMFDPKLMPAAVASSLDTLNSVSGTRGALWRSCLRRPSCAPTLTEQQEKKKKKQGRHKEGDILLHGLQACEEPEGLCDADCTVAVKHSR